jgi:A/G-specific adenine glycosylase
VKPKSQSWHGTDRQCRGTVMKFLRENDRATKGALSKIWSDKKQLEKALQSLIEDGLIQKRKSSFFLAE